MQALVSVALGVAKQPSPSNTSIFNYLRNKKLVQTIYLQPNLFNSKVINARHFTSAVHSEIGVVKPGEFSYLSIPGKCPLITTTVGQLVDRAAEKFGDTVAFIDRIENERLSFLDVKTESDKLASGFLKIGLKPGDRLGIWGPNSREWYIADMAAAKAGLISVYLNPAYQTRELLYSMNKVGMTGILIAGNFKTQNYYKMLVEALPELDTAPLGNLKSDMAPLTTVISMEANPPGRGTFTYPNILSEGDSPDALEGLRTTSSLIQFDDVRNIQFTSGTTGNPKGVMVSHHNIVNNSLLVGKRLEMSAKDRICVTVPLFHCYGNVLSTLLAFHFGASIVFPSPSFNPLAGLQATALERCTIMYGTPTMHIDILNHPTIKDYDLSSLRVAVTAGAICPHELIKEMKDTYTVDSVVNLYGSTELSPIVLQSLPNDSDEVRAETVGYPLQHTEIKLVDTEGRIVRVGTEGEICARGYMTMLGYWGDPEKTKEAIDSARWYHTGDLFVMTESGHGKIVGRLKDMIIRGGENIYPKEIEEFLHSHVSILEAQVFGVPDKRLGETVAAWLRVKEGAELSPEDVKSFCKGQISHFKIPQYIVFATHFPKTTSGKIQKFAMRNATIQDLGLDGK